jgi:molecular chaperone HtpG
VGEIYVFDENLVPNARRDDFEKNETYYAFKREVEKTTHILARLPHPYSKIRSNEKKLQEIPQKIEEIEEELTTSGITETRREKLIEQVDGLKKKAKTIDPKAYDKIKSPLSVSNQDVSKDSQTDGKASNGQVTGNNDSSKVEDVKQIKGGLLNKLEDLEGKIETSTNYVAQQLPSTISRTCRKEIDKIFNVIDRVLDEGLAKELKVTIIEELQPKGKTGQRK